MPINWRLAAEEVRFILDHSQARALVCDDDARRPGRRRDRPPRRRHSSGCASATEPVDGLGAVRRPRPPAPRPVAARAHAAGDDIHRLMYTSGTTGRPKGVMISHANLAWKNYAHIAELGFTAADVGLACGPLYHVGALDLVTTSMIAVGRDDGHPPDVRRRRGRRRDRAVAGHRACGRRRRWSAPILDVPGVDERDLSSVQVIIAGGEKMPIPTIERIRATFPSAWFADAYGLTETVSGDTFLDRDSTITKLGSVGRPCQYLELDIWDEDGRVGARRREGRGRAARARRCSPATGAIPTPPPGRSPAAGSTPATSACWTTTATSTSSTGSRT